MKTLLISIHPQWVELILNLIKKDEIRKGTAIGKAINKLIEEQGVAPTLIYCTKGKPYYYVSENCVYKTRYDFAENLNGKVVARFNATAEHIEYETCSRDISGWWKDNGKMYDLKDACLTYKEMFDYIGAGEGTVVHINDLEIFDKPKELSEFYGCCDNYTKNVNIFKNINDRYIAQYFNNPKCLKCKHYDGDNWCSKIEEPLTRAPQSWCYVEV